MTGQLLFSGKLRPARCKAPAPLKLGRAGHVRSARCVIARAPGNIIPTLLGHGSRMTTALPKAKGEAGWDYRPHLLRQLEQT